MKHWRTMIWDQLDTVAQWLAWCLCIFSPWKSTSACWKFHWLNDTPVIRTIGSNWLSLYTSEEGQALSNNNVLCWLLQAVDSPCQPMPAPIGSSLDWQLTWTNWIWLPTILGSLLTCKQKLRVRVCHSLHGGGGCADITQQLTVAILWCISVFWTDCFWIASSGHLAMYQHRFCLNFIDLWIKMMILRWTVSTLLSFFFYFRSDSGLALVILKWFTSVESK